MTPKRRLLTLIFACLYSKVHGNFHVPFTAHHKARYMEISMYLEVCFVPRYMEISMYLEMKHMARYMEISTYLATKHMARISMYLSQHIIRQGT